MLCVRFSLACVALLCSLCALSSGRQPSRLETVLLRLLVMQLVTSRPHQFCVPMIGARWRALAILRQLRRWTAIECLIGRGRPRWTRACNCALLKSRNQTEKAQMAEIKSVADVLAKLTENGTVLKYVGLRQRAEARELNWRAAFVATGSGAGTWKRSGLCYGKAWNCRGSDECSRQGNAVGDEGETKERRGPEGEKRARRREEGPLASELSVRATCSHATSLSHVRRLRTVCVSRGLEMQAPRPSPPHCRCARRSRRSSTTPLSARLLARWRPCLTQPPSLVPQRWQQWDGR